MDEEREKEVTPEKEEGKPSDVSKREFKEAEYHKPPDEDDNPPTPTPSPDQKDRDDDKD